MGKLHIAIIIFSIITIVSSNGKTISSKKWLEKARHAKGKVTELQYYVQDLFSSPTPSNIQVARANSTFSSPTFFGLVSVLDDPVRTLPGPNATIVGRAQGFFAFSSLEDMSLHMTFDLVFTGGRYNGSTLNVVGHNAYQTASRELSIVGGSGAFRLARGFIGVRTVSMNSTTGDAFFQYNISVLHYWFIYFVICFSWWKNLCLIFFVCYLFHVFLGPILGFRACI